MAGSVNKVILVGNLGKDPDIRSTQNGNEIANFSIATSESWKDKNTGEKKEKTEWHRISVFSPGLVGIVKNYVKKGTKLYIEGTLQTRKWQDQNGVEKYTTEVVLQNYNSSLTILDNRGSSDSSSYNNSDSNNNQGNYNNSNNGNNNSSDNSGFTSEELDDEIPF